MELPAEAVAGMVDYMESSQKLLQKIASEREAVRNNVPEVVDQLIKAGLLDSAARDTAIQTLGDSHIKALESLKVAAETRSAAPPLLGSSVSEKSAAAPADPYNRFTSEADRNFEQALLDGTGF